MHKGEVNQSREAVGSAENAPLSEATMSALGVVAAWGQAMDDLDEEALVALAHQEIEIVTEGGTKRGHDALRDWLGKQTYGVVPRFERRRTFARGETLVIDLRVEFRYLDGGGSRDLRMPRPASR